MILFFEARAQFSLAAPNQDTNNGGARIKNGGELLLRIENRNPASSGGCLVSALVSHDQSLGSGSTFSLLPLTTTPLYLPSTVQVAVIGGKGAGLICQQRKGPLPRNRRRGNLHTSGSPVENASPRSRSCLPEHHPHGHSLPVSKRAGGACSVAMVGNVSVRELNTQGMSTPLPTPTHFSLQEAQ